MKFVTIIMRMRTLAMIEQVLIISCEHQSYRRAANLAFLEYYKYPIDIIDIVWGMHANYFDVDLLNSSLRNMIGRDFKNNVEKEEKHGISATEAYIRALTKVVSDNKNTLILEDDHFVLVSLHDLNGKLIQLSRIVDIGVVQLHSRGQKLNDLEEVLVTEDFIQGSVRSSKVCNFWTPEGAKKFLTAIQSEKIGVSPENTLPCHLYDRNWVFSARNPDKYRKYAFHCKYLDGDSIGYYYTISGYQERRTEKQVKQSISIIEKFKL